MLEVNPHYVNREQTDTLNVIDARWVDTTSGLFIDITTARYNTTHPAGDGMLSCKDGHEYRDSYIFPLRDTYFEGAPAKIPFAYKEVLEAEYRERALTLQDFEGHHFDENKMEWIPVPKKIEPPKKEEKKPDPPKQVAPKSQSPPPQSPPPQKPAQQAPSQQQQPQAQKQPEAKAIPAKQAPKAEAPPDKQPQGQSSPQQAPPQQKPVGQQSVPQQQSQKQTAPAMPQGLTSPAPPVSKKAAPAVDPKQKAFEEKARAAAQKRQDNLARTEEKRKLSEGKAIAKEEKRKIDEQKALANQDKKNAQKAAEEKAAAEKKAKEVKQSQASSVNNVHGPRPTAVSSTQA